MELHVLREMRSTTASAWTMDSIIIDHVVAVDVEVFVWR